MQLEQDHKRRIRDHIQTVVRFIASRKREWALVYFHMPDLFTKGPINVIKTAFATLEEEEQQKVRCFVTIYMNRWANMMSKLALVCRNAGHDVRRLNFECVLDFLRENEDDPKFCAAVLAGLPKEIMTKYFEERRVQNYEPPEFLAEAGGIQSIAGLMNSQDIGGNQVNVNNLLEESKDTAPVEKTTDVFGKSLRQFKQLDGHDKNSPPLVFHLVIGYFQTNPETLKSEGLFRVATDMALVHELEVHLAMENYHHITQVASPNVVTNYFKLMMREMSDPICPYYLYDNFMALTTVDREERVEPLKKLVR